MDIMISAIVGIIVGILANFLCRFLVRKRDKDNVSSWILYGKYSFIMWALIFAGIFVLLILVTGNILFFIECAILFSICFCISCVDFIIKKIPNEMLLLLFINKIVFMFINYADINIMHSIRGLFFGLIIFMLPSYLGIKIGWGDIKFAAVVGFCLGINGFLQAIIIMALALGVLAGMLLISKKGTLKTSAAMGPYISLGVVITALFPLV